MPILNTIHAEQGVIVMRLVGKVTYREFVLALGELWRDERAVGTDSRIMDLRDCMVALNVDEAQTVSRLGLLEAKRFGTQRVAVLLAPLADRSMFKIIEREVMSNGVQVEFFDDAGVMMEFIESNSTRLSVASQRFLRRQAPAI